MKAALFVCALFAVIRADEFAACLERHSLSTAEQGTLFTVAIDKDRLLAIGDSPLPKGWESLRYDPLTGLTLAKAAHNLLPIVLRGADRINEHKEAAFFGKSGISIVPAQSVKRQNGVETAGGRATGTLLTSPCFGVTAIATDAGFIESEFLRRFIDSNQSGRFFWGDLGVRLKGFTVEFIDPFVRASPLLAGDKIVSINGVSFGGSYELERAVLLLEPETTAAIAIERGGRLVELQSPVYRRLGGFLFADTFLERLGIRFDKALFVRSVESINGRTLPIALNDRLISINGIQVADDRGVRAALSAFNGQIRLLMQRSDFQFFINVDMESYGF
ncbi:MAG: hypothetical protein LBE89_01630 [Helicobacteraceae bacterium]|nr:hypothetical protein [Helicobacteraceae bacterium]